VFYLHQDFSEEDTLILDRMGLTRSPVQPWRRTVIASFTTDRVSPRDDTNLMYVNSSSLVEMALRVRQTLFPNVAGDDSF
jgi:hypothetical protein